MFAFSECLLGSGRSRVLVCPFECASPVPISALYKLVRVVLVLPVAPLVVRV